MDEKLKNETNIIKRVRQFCLYKEIPVSEFEKRSGLSNGYFLKLTTDAIGARKLRDIADAYPELSLSWLLTGDGPMLLNGGSVSAVNIGGDNNQNATAIVETIAHQLDEKDKQIDRLLGVIENLSNK